MCGIAGYLGDRNAPEILVDMLKRLEYRGYDSAGIACVTDSGFFVKKDKGKVSEVFDSSLSGVDSSQGIAHTRWATHGIPSKSNAHPHADDSTGFIVAHNGIIENFRDLKGELSEKGHAFSSETDSEVIPHLIADLYDGDFESAFVSALKKLRGSFALVAISKEDPGVILAARKDSPLILGLGDCEFFIASDTPAILPYTSNVLVLDDFEYAVIGRSGVVVKDIKSSEEVRKEVQEISWTIEEAEKGGFEHFMLKEIFEEPSAVESAFSAASEIEEIASKLKSFSRIYFVACGTASYAGLVGKYVLERFSLPSELVLGSEFRYSTVNSVGSDCAIIAVSQSGETADTLASVRAAQGKGAYVLSVVNVLGSTLSRVSDDVIYTRSGPEIAVASTKAYMGQITALLLLGVFLAREHGKASQAYVEEILSDLYVLPAKIGEVLSRAAEIEALASKLSEKNIFFYIGRRLNYPTALEGALKLKEISYVHAEAYAAGELKHGPLALLEDGVPVVAINPNDDLSEKMDSNIQEAKSRGASLFTVSEEGDLKVPIVDPLLSPLISIVPLHLFAYYVAVAKGLDPDKPRNLAKSVTVE